MVEFGTALASTTILFHFWRQKNNKMEARGEVLQVGPGSADIVEIPCCAKWGIKLIRELTHGEVLPPFNVRTMTLTQPS